MKIWIGILRSRDTKLNLISVILPLFAEATLTRLSNLVTLYKGLAVEVINRHSTHCPERPCMPHHPETRSQYFFLRRLKGEVKAFTA
jgi:hypothetical protein